MNEKYQKVSKFKCENCNYYCDEKSNYKKHLKTKKHTEKMKQVDLNTSTIHYQKVSNHKCYNCNKVYKSRNGLWYHKHICVKNNTVTDNTNSNNEKLILQLIAQNQELTHLLTNQKEETKELCETIKHQSVTIQEIIPKIGNTFTTNNTKFNLNVFLNEDCKDAINFSDFIKSIQVSVEDLENQSQLGYVNGITKVFLDNMKKLSINKRPVHCTDKKRNTLYVKEDDEWSKEGSHDTIKKGIQEITSRTHGTLIQMKRDNAEEYADGDSDFSNKCINIQRNLTPSYPRETSIGKIVGNISDNTILGKPEEENHRKMF